MKVAEAVGGSIAGVVGGVYSIVSYVNPLSSSSSSSKPSSDDKQEDAGNEQGTDNLVGSNTAASANSQTPDEQSSISSKGDTPPSILHGAADWNSVAADIDERLVADANADNPENNRPPTPTKPSFTRMLRFPTPAVADASMHASKAEYKQAVRNDPVSMNVSQRTGHQFRPGTEEKRRYMRRMSKAPQLNAPPDNSESLPASSSSATGGAVHRAPSRSHQQESGVGDGGDSSEESDDSDEDLALDSSDLNAAIAAEYYQAAAESQRYDSKTRAVEPWRFIIPKVKRVKRRALWRLFLAQEIAPTVYDEAGEQKQQLMKLTKSATNSSISSPIISPQRVRNLPLSPIAASTTLKRNDQPANISDLQLQQQQPQQQDANSLRRRMLETAALRTTSSSPDSDLSSQQQQQQGSAALQAKSSQTLKKTRPPSLAPSIESHNSAKTATISSAAPSKQQQQPSKAGEARKNGIWTMEFSVCGKYLAAGGQDGVVRIWRIAAFAREQEREKRQHASASASASPTNADMPANGAQTPTSATFPSSRQQQQPQPQQQQQQPAAILRGKHTAARDTRYWKVESLESPLQSPRSPSHKRTSTAYIDSTEIMPFANSAPIAKGHKHQRSISLAQPLMSPRSHSFMQQEGSGALMTDTSASATPVSAAAADHEGGTASSRPSSRTSSMANDTQSIATAAAAASQLHPMHAYELLEPMPFRSYVGHTADILSLSWSKNGFLLTASMDRTVRLWHPHRPECLCTFRHRDIVTSVAFNPRDDRLFISGSLDCKLRLWDIPARGVKHWTKLPDGQMVTSVAFTSPKGDHIVAGTYRGMCVFYSTDGLTVQGRMHARSSRGRNSKGSKITGFAYLPTGEMPPQLIRQLALPPKPVDSSGYQLLVSSNDSRLRMFHPHGRHLERKYKGHANASSQAFARLSSDGRYIISGSEDHNIYVWSVAQDNAATVSTHPNSDHIRRVRGGGGGNSGKKPSTNITVCEDSNSASAASAVAAPPKPEKHILSGLFSRRRGDKPGDANGSCADANASSPAPGDGEWESLDGKVEEKSIYEYFPAHDAAVSQALFVPSSTLQYLAAHDDPILSRRKMRVTSTAGEVENVLPAAANATFGDASGENNRLPPISEQKEEGKDRSENSVEDMTAIIVSADTSGNIRVFRKDINVHCMYIQQGRGSRSSLVKTKESVGSIGQLASRDKHSTTDIPGENDSLKEKSAAKGSARAKQTSDDLSFQQQQQQQQQHEQQNADAVAEDSSRPRLARGTSFWNKIGLKRSNTTMATKRHSSIDPPVSRLETVVASSSAEAADADSKEKPLLHPKSPTTKFASLSAKPTARRARIPLAPPPAVTPSAESSDSCAYCGHCKFIEFSVASPTTAAATISQEQHQQHDAPTSSLAVCENCKRVKNMPL
ncbi:hypothetical protein GGI12_003137 [Dipsacomyces acuminosporus]|nr:hypothetical protein GGI12_003137 [Dipsacomyces acuminosporus]